MTVILCWHKTRVVEEMEVAKVNKEWFNSIAHGDLDVLKFYNDKALVLSSDGKWSRVKPAKAAE